MKKSLSLLIALAMVFGMFASMASAATAELTTAQKYQLFVDQGVLKGDPSGNPRLDATLTRAEFATIVASVGGLKLVNSTSSFSDVKAKDWYFTAIQSASDAGLVNGIGAGKFGPKLNVTVEQVAKVAVILAGIKPVDGAVVAGSSAWAGPYIQAAINAGLAVPSNYKANATRAQTIDLAYAVYQLKALPVLSDVTATVNSDDTITVSGKVVGTADSVKVALGTATAVAATLKDDKTFTYTTAKQVAGTYKLTVVAYDGTKASVSVEKEVTIGGFVVESATAVNSKQLVVKFNKAVQEGASVGGVTYGVNNTSTAAQTSYVIFGGQEPASATVSADKMTVTYNFANWFTQNAYNQLSITGIKSASGQALTAYKSAILTNDTTAPTITGVSYTGNVATLTLSEPVEVAGLGTISINGSAKTIVAPASIPSSGLYVSYGTDSEGKVTTVKVGGLDVATNYAFNLVGGHDVNNLYFDYSTTLNVPSDTTSPTVTSLTVNGGIITAKFSEALSTAGSVYNNSAVASKVDGVLSSDKLSATYDTTAAGVSAQWLNGNTFLNTTAVLKGYQDLLGNTGSSFSQAVTLSKDTTNPTVVSAMYDGTYVVIKFSEPVAVSAGTVTYKYTNTNSVVGAAQSWSGFTSGYDIDNNPDVVADGENLYIKKQVGALDAGTYNISSIPSGTVKDLADRSNDAGSASFTVAAGSATGSIDLVSVATEGNSKLLFTFDEALATSALDVSKYTVNGVALPTGAKLYFQGSQSVVAAEIPAGTFTASGSREFKVNNIVGTTGNTLSSNVSYVLNVKENVAPIATTVTVINDQTLRVAFSETVNDDATVTGVSVYLNGSTSAVTGLGYAANGGYLYITGSTGTFSNTAAISVKFASSDIVDVSGNAAADVTINK
ncbi:S-layer homology domain-containing protein [Cohnella sp. OV330]|uniref:S-layer homology domain-containing protein n=1 Tax=Cohnella sp. OV330 TaxID=1855288 RepID=UPI0008F2904C|nr:S-layer homology domain-containing protein [Cohnella sp. OV330]SFB47395.1 S-layer homology domain-containing protein [Cohnella sp. OV330]